MNSAAVALSGFPSDGARSWPGVLPLDIDSWCAGEADADADAGPKVPTDQDPELPRAEPNTNGFASGLRASRFGIGAWMGMGGTGGADCCCC